MRDIGDTFRDVEERPNVLRVLAHVETRGEAREDTMNPRWVRLDTTSDELSGVTRVALTERRITRVIGGFLPPMSKEKLAKSLAQALAAAKR